MEQASAIVAASTDRFPPIVLYETIFVEGKKMRRNHSLGSNTKRAEIFLSLRSRISSLPVRFFDRRKQRRYQRISPAHPFRKIISTSASALNCWKNISSIKIISFIFSLILNKMSFRLKKNLNDRESLMNVRDSFTW